MPHVTTAATKHPLKTAVRSSWALLCSLRNVVQDNHTSNWANAELLLSVTSLPDLVSTFVR